MGALAEFERDLIRERTKAGMKAAKKRGKHIGRPRALSQGQIQHMHELLKQGKTQGEIAELLGVSSNTIGREIAQKRKHRSSSTDEGKKVKHDKISDFKEEK